MKGNLMHMPIRPQLQQLADLGKTLEHTENKRQKVLTFMQEAPCICFMKDAKTGQYQFMNRAGCEAIGKPESEIVGKSDWELFPPKTANSMMKHDIKVLRSRKSVTTIEARSYRDDILHLYLVSKFLVVNGDESIAGLAFEIPDDFDFKIESPEGVGNGL